MAGVSSTPVPSLAISFARRVLPPFRTAVQLATKPLPSKGNEVRRSRTGSQPTGSSPQPFLTVLIGNLHTAEEHIMQWSASGCPEGSPEEKQVLTLLTLLEETTKDKPNFQKKKPSTYIRSSYPNLDAISQLPQSKQTPAVIRCSKNIKSLGESRRLLKSQRENLDAELKKLGELIGDKSRVGQPNSQTEGIKDADWPEYVQELHSVLEEACACSLAGNPGFIINVGLTPVEADAAKDSVRFRLFIQHLHANEDTLGGWRETQISITRRRHSSHQPHIAPEEFCKLIRGRRLSYPVLKGAGGGLTKEGDFPQSIMVVDEPSVSLGSLILEKKLQGNDALRVKLSYLVAKAVWQFYDSPWMSEIWSKDTIHFMKEENIIDQSIWIYLQKPFITAKMGSRKRDSRTLDIPVFEAGDEPVSDSAHLHYNPHILALGIMLWEIFRGEGIDRFRMQQRFRDSEGKLLKDADLIIARFLIEWEKQRKPREDKESSNAEQTLVKVIDFCINSGTAQLGRSSEEVRANLHAHVVAPLDELYRKICSKDYVPDPIELPLDSVLRQQNYRHEASASMTPSDQQSLEVRQVQSSIRRDIVFNEKIFNDDASDGELKFGGKETHGDEASRRQTDKWIESFQKLLMKHDIQAKTDSNVIKIAIIDSGIAYDHMELDRSRIRGLKSWVENSDAKVDNLGHGTHVAGIILQLTTNVELYIGKVTDTRKFKSRDSITKALKHARTEWKVDMISLSFGFDEPDTDEHREIQNCITEKIIIFSSASNDGGKGSRTYPAAYDQVICIHSATPQGIVAASNPSAMAKKDNFSTVGENVRSYWHLPKIGGEGRDNEKACEFSYQSGTSVATPVAVSIAAFMIGYLRKYAEGHKWGIDPWTPLGMQAIFQKMKEDRDGYEWISLQRYFGRKKTTEEVLRSLKERLK